MKGLIAIGSILVCASLSQAATYLRPEAAFLMPEEKGLKNTGGAFLALGFSPKGHGEHDFEAEIGWAKFNYQETLALEDFDLTGKISYRIMPILANYRYNTNVAKGMIGYFQVGAGYADASVHWSGDVNGETAIRGSDSSGVFAYDIGLGASWKAGENNTFNVGYRYINVGSMDVNLGTDTVRTGSQGAHVIDAGLTFRF